MPPITLYFLQASRCIRTAWLLEELKLDYDLQFSDRTAASKAPDEFKQASGNPLGKFPTLRDGERVVYESGAITEYVVTFTCLFADRGV
jgi:glutathione S-transferase